MPTKLNPADQKAIIICVI